MWSGEVGPYEGKHYHLAETLNSPQALTSPHPRIMIGGGGERKTLRLVAQYGDACNLFDGPELPHKLDVLRNWCAEVGRPYGEIEKTVTLQLPVSRNGDDGTVSLDEGLERLARLAELGIDQALVMIQEPIAMETIDVFGERIIPEAGRLVPAGRERATTGIA
jgi:hypothetical protein